MNYRKFFDIFIKGWFDWRGWQELYVIFASLLGLALICGGIVDFFQRQSNWWVFFFPGIFFFWSAYKLASKLWHHEFDEEERGKKRLRKRLNL